MKDARVSVVNVQVLMKRTKMELTNTRAATTAQRNKLTHCKIYVHTLLAEIDKQKIWRNSAECREVMSGSAEKRL